MASNITKTSLQQKEYILLLANLKKYLKEQKNIQSDPVKFKQANNHGYSLFILSKIDRLQNMLKSSVRFLISFFFNAFLTNIVKNKLEIKEKLYKKKVQYGKR